MLLCPITTTYVFSLASQQIVHLASEGLQGLVVRSSFLVELSNILRVNLLVTVAIEE